MAVQFNCINHCIAPSIYNRNIFRFNSSALNSKRVAFNLEQLNLITQISPRTRSLKAQNHTARISTVCGGAATEATQTAKDIETVRVKYSRRDKNYKGWGLHIWGDVAFYTDWQKGMEPTGMTDEGPYWDVPLRKKAKEIGVLIHQGETKAAGATIRVSSLGADSSVWLVGDKQGAYSQLPDTSHDPVGNLQKHFAHWVNDSTLVWRMPVSDSTGTRIFKLHYSKDAKLHITGQGVGGADLVIPLEPKEGPTPNEVIARFPHLYGTSALVFPESALGKIPELVKGHLAVSVADSAGAPINATGVQIQGVLDTSFAYTGPLGYHPSTSGSSHAITVWAPTAKKVVLLHWRQPQGGNATEYEMAKGERGTWTFPVPEDWCWSYYKFRVEVLSPLTGRFERSEVTDPYSRNTCGNGERTQIVDLTAPSTTPQGWDMHTAPTPLESWTDITLYELHVRDFSASDQSVPAQLRGKYLAFSPRVVAAATANGSSNQGQVPLSKGLEHLLGLSEAGLTHVHLLPTYDFGSVPERDHEQAKLTEDLWQHPPDSEYQQNVISRIADRDAFNWGYDPVHYGVPEGSYSTNPDGPARVLEYREMVMGLHSLKLRVVLDVVYNHTFSAGPHNNMSVLDKVVPGYYHRRMEDGEMCHSTCCNNVATEHFMTERLIVEDLVHWAKDYKVDGFRFDIMGHLMLSTMKKIRAGLDELTLEKDKVAGSTIYMYGEGWDFGEVINNQRGRNAAQMNIAGTGLGVFNDRLRDGALGGGPFSPLDHQGLVTGLALAPNTTAKQGDAAAQLAALGQLTDMVKFSLAGLLRDYQLQLFDGSVKRGIIAQAHGLPLAYGGQPCEHVAFIGCHDNETMFDQITEKAAADEGMEERWRMQGLCLSLILLSQGIPFVHAGDELLRSKSLDRDSYNSGDWFNRIDWTGQHNNFGVGLPVASKNRHNWPFKRTILANRSFRPDPEHISATAGHLRMLLQLRYSSPLFRLPTTEAVSEQLHFHNNGVGQVPGLIVMELVSGQEGSNSRTYDPNYKRIVVVFNCSPGPLATPYPLYAGSMQLHPLMASWGDARVASSSVDEEARTLLVPGRVTAVFVEPW